MGDLDPVPSCRTALLRYLTDQHLLQCPCVILVPGSRRRTQYPTGEDVFPVVQPSTFVYVAGHGVPFYDAVCALQCESVDQIKGQLLVPCTPSQRIFDGCTPDRFDGTVVETLELPHNVPVHYLHTGTTSTTDLTPWISGASPLATDAFPLCRSVKTAEEHACIQRACDITGLALQRTVRHLRKRWERGKRISEAALAQAFRYYCTSGGGGEMSFPPIVASGVHAATLHHVPGTEPVAADRPVIGMTSLGSSCLSYMKRLKPALEDRGFEVAIFHATGMGGMAFENIARGGGFAAVMDFALSEIGNLYAGSVVNSGEQRLRSAGGAGIPQIVAPGCIDLIDFAGWQDIPERFLDRPFHAHNRLIKCSAFNAAERRETARFVAERLAGARGPTHFILPAGGIEEWDKPGEPAHDPEGLAAFCDEVRKVMKPPVILSETAAHINDQGFADLALSILDGWIEDGTVAAPASNKEPKS